MHLVGTGGKPTGQLLRYFHNAGHSCVCYLSEMQLSCCAVATARRHGWINSRADTRTHPLLPPNTICCAVLHRNVAGVPAGRRQWHDDGTQRLAPNVRMHSPGRSPCWPVSLYGHVQAHMPALAPRPLFLAVFFVRFTDTMCLTPHHRFFAVESAFMAYFTIEYLMRL